MNETPYSREEMERLPEGEFPKRGEHCEKCNAYIPTFADLTPADVRRIRSLPVPQQIRDVRGITSCPLKWAKIWALHPNGPQPKFGKTGPLCPECGNPLRTEKAKQCIHCGADWHQDA